MLIYDKKHKEDDIIPSEKLENDHNEFIDTITKVSPQKWYIKITLRIHNEYEFTSLALLDSGADQNCICEGLIPTKYYEKNN